MKCAEPEEDTRVFASALTAAPDSAAYVLRLFVSGTTPRSSRAISNIKALCEARLCGRYELEVIDIFQHPELAKPEQIVVTPTLVKKFPLPARRVIGDLSDHERVLEGLDLVAGDAAVTVSKTEPNA